MGRTAALDWIGKGGIGRDVAVAAVEVEVEVDVEGEEAEECCVYRCEKACIIPFLLRISTAGGGGARCICAFVVMLPSCMRCAGCFML